MRMGCNSSKESDQWAHSNQNGDAEKPTAIVQPEMRPVDVEQDSVDAQTIEEYLELEKKIAAAEASSPALVLQQKKDQLEHLEERIKQQQKNYKALEKQTEKISHDTDLLGPLEEHLLEDQVRKKLLELSEEKHDEKREALAAFNNKEIAKKELDNLLEQKNSLDDEVLELGCESSELQALYARQDLLLAKIFGGDYGSDEENQLESSLDQQEEMRNRIVEANFKWKQAQMMVDYAFKQLNEAVVRWQSLPNIDQDKLEERYGVASVARNNLVAASQNIQGAQRYLSNVQFPYCAPAEVATLNKATAYIFTDMQTPDRHQHALDCYSTTHKRCGALLQWINQVVNTTISKDLDDSNKKVKDIAMDLRRERVRLIKIKAKEVTGKDVEIAVNDINTDVDVNLNMNDLARTEGIDPSLLASLTAEELAALSAISADDLAPPPSQEEVFGEQMEQLKDEFMEETARIDKQFAENQARTKDALAAKLEARRQRRARKNLEEKEKAAFKPKKH